LIQAKLDRDLVSSRKDRRPNVGSNSTKSAVVVAIIAAVASAGAALISVLGSLSVSEKALILL